MDTSYMHYSLLLLVTGGYLTTCTYLSGLDDKSNSASHVARLSNHTQQIHHGDKQPIYKRYRHYGPFFKNDWEVMKYLKIFDRDVMIWKCKNSIQPYWEWRPLDFVELYCEAVGNMKAVRWFHAGKQLKLGGRYTQHIMPHYASGRYYSRWIDFRLRIHNATRNDSGMYMFKVISPTNQYQEHVMYVDISNKKRKKNYWVKP